MTNSVNAQIRDVIDGTGKSTAADTGVTAPPGSDAPAPLRPSITCGNTWPVIEGGMNIANLLAFDWNLRTGVDACLARRPAPAVTDRPSLIEWGAPPSGGPQEGIGPGGRHEHSRSRDGRARFAGDRDEADGAPDSAGDRTQGAPTAAARTAALRSRWSTARSATARPRSCARGASSAGSPSFG